jgi:hypothetical protein
LGVSRSAIIPAMLGTISQLVHKLLTLLSSPWVGFLLKAFGGGAALIFGLLGLGANVRDVNGVVTDKGRLLRKGIIIGGALAIASVVYDFSIAQKSAQALSATRHLSATRNESFIFAAVRQRFSRISGIREVPGLADLEARVL